MNRIWICVYRDTIEEHNDDWECNLASVMVLEDFVEQYLKECHKGEYNSLEEFMNEYIADDTADFYDYAMKHDAIIEVENW